MKVKLLRAFWGFKKGASASLLKNAKPVAGYSHRLQLSDTSIALVNPAKDKDRLYQ